MKKTRVFALLLSVILIVACVPAFAAQSATSPLSTVTTKYGELQGVAGDTYHGITVFKGVPYAAPPVGDLRWKAPQDCQPWEGLRVCDTFGNAAVQPAYVAQVTDYTNKAYEWREFYPDGVPANSEDCLYLDIYSSAATTEDKRPVLVWFHGGGFAHGWGYEVEFNGEALADKGVIVVDVTHRLNIFGLLSLPQLSKEAEYGGSGNYMVMDCAKAINWVYENIAAFGGDPKRITIAGQSGGNGKTTAALVSPLTDGQIYGTYNMSALNPYGKYQAQKDAEAAGLAYLKALGKDENTSLEELRAIPASELIKAYDSFKGSICIDGYSITMNPSEFYLTPGNLDGLNMMFGSVFGENGTYDAKTAAELLGKIREQYGDELYNKYDIANTMEITDSNVVLYNRLLKVMAAQAGNRMFAAIANKQNKDLEIYGFSFARVTPGSKVGWHSSELWYMFGSLRDNGRQRDWQVWDHMTAENCTSYWANYISTGSPNGSGIANWPACTIENGLDYQYLDYMPTTASGLTSFDKMVMESIAIKNGIDFASLGL